MPDLTALPADLGVCNAPSLDPDRCPGLMLVEHADEEWVETRCAVCGSTAAVHASKLKPREQDQSEREEQWWSGR